MLKIFLSCYIIFTFAQNGISSVDAPKPSSSFLQPKDTTKTDTINNSEDGNNRLQIDTALGTKQQQTIVPNDTLNRIDSTLIEPLSENVLTNTKLFIYILLSVLGLGLFFFIFVITLFKTFHKKKSTRQSLLLSWNLFFIISIIWIFIIWGLVAGFWTYPSFMIVVIFLFIISLIMTIIAVKSK
jgi:membrane-associated HD superfamily phosphohydrolase